MITTNIRGSAGLGLFCVGLATLAACASTPIKSSWKLPDLQPLDFQKTIVVFMSANEGVRRTAEERLVGRLGAGKAVASYTLLPGEDGSNPERARTTIRNAGFDSAVVMRTISRDQQLSYTPGMTYPSPYRSFYGYYGYGWPVVRDPGYLRTDTVVTVETNLYSVTDDRLLWSGVTETFNPRNVATLVDHIADAVAHELKRQGLLR